MQKQQSNKLQQVQQKPKKEPRQQVQQPNQLFAQQQQIPQQQQLFQNQQQQQFQQQPMFINNNNFNMNNNNNLNMYINRHNNSIFGNKNNQTTQKLFENGEPDDEIIEQLEKVKNVVKNTETQKTLKNLNEILDFSLTSMTKAVKLNSKKNQFIPAMVSLNVKEEEQTEGMELENEESKNDNETRPSIDLICLIDRSGSMQGNKIEQVRETLKYITEFLNENDRICLIQFDHQSQRILPFKKVNKQNSSLILEQINSIQPNGGTNIKQGIQKAVQYLEQRKQKNPVTSVFLLSDGQTSKKNECIGYCDSLTSNQNAFTIHSFGFGNDHDPELMNNIASTKDGNFYYVEDIKLVDEMFIDALGGLFSVVAQNVKITLKPQYKGHQIFGDVQVSKTYGEMWKKQGENYQIDIIQLIQGINKEYMLEIKLPPMTHQLQDYERNTVLFEACIEIPEQNIKKISNLELTFYNENEEIPEEVQKVNEDVEFNYLRVRGAEVIKNCMQEAERGQFEKGQEIIKNMQDEINRAKPQNVQRLQMLYSDLEDNKKSCNQQKYQQEGRFKMINNNRAHMNQQSKPQAFNAQFVSDQQMARMSDNSNNNNMLFQQQQQQQQCYQNKRQQNMQRQAISRKNQF